MKRFRYRLQKVLTVREKLKDEALRELMARNSELFAEKDREGELLKAFMANRIEEGTILSHAELLTTSGYAARLNEEIAAVGLRIIKAQEAVDLATAKYIEASKEAKVLTTHKENKVTEYKEETLKEEERFLDELATQRAARRLQE